MIVVLIISFIIGLIISGITGIGLLGFIAGIFIFLLGLPGALIGGFIFDMSRYSHDRQDRRQRRSDISADIRADEHEFREDLRNERRSTKVYNDNRKQFLNVYGGRDEYGRVN